MVDVRVGTHGSATQRSKSRAAVSALFDSGAALCRSLPMALLGVALALVACGRPETSVLQPRPTADGTSTQSPPSEPIPTPTQNFQARMALTAEDDAKPRAKQRLFGWQIGPGPFPEEAENHPEVTSGCEVEQVEASTPTDLDVSVTYLPKDAEIQKTQDLKSRCGDVFIVSTRLYWFRTPHGFGEGQLVVEREHRWARVITIDAANDRVATGTVNGKPAILVRNMDPEKGWGLADIFVIEADLELAPDGTVSKPATILHVQATEGVPFDQLLKTAEGVD